MLGLRFYGRFWLPGLVIYNGLWDGRHHGSCLLLPDPAGGNLDGLRKDGRTDNCPVSIGCDDMGEIVLQKEPGEVLDAGTKLAQYAACGYLNQYAPFYQSEQPHRVSF